MYGYRSRLSTEPIIPIRETDAELRARVMYVTGEHVTASGAALDEIAERYGLRRRCKP